MLTGRLRFRTTWWRRRQILQIEERTRLYLAGEPAGVPALVWRDATEDEGFETLVRLLEFLSGRNRADE